MQLCTTLSSNWQ